MGDLDLSTVRRALGAGAALVLVGLAALWLLRPAPTPIEESLPMASASPSTSEPVVASTGGPDASSTSTPTEVVAHAAGAVARPGVYRLDAGARVDDLIAAAGGLGAEADASRVNLAAPVSDGSRVYVPREGEEVPAAVVPEGGAAPAAGSGGEGGSGAASGGPLDLNTADEAALDTLPGVGPATAQAIIAHREQVGAFTSVEELLDVRGIGEAKLEQIRPLVTV